MFIEDQPSIKFVPRGWGFEKIICDNRKYSGRMFYFVKGGKCPLYFNSTRDKTFYVQSGKIRVYYSDDLALLEEAVAKLNVEYAGNSKMMLYTLLDKGLREIILKKGDNFYIPPNRAHQVVAIEDTELIEFSTAINEDSHIIMEGD